MKAIFYTRVSSNEQSLLVTLERLGLNQWVEELRGWVLLESLSTQNV